MGSTDYRRAGGGVNKAGNDGFAPRAGYGPAR